MVRFLVEMQRTSVIVMAWPFLVGGVICLVNELARDRWGAARRLCYLVKSLNNLWGFCY